MVTKLYANLSNDSIGPSSGSDVQKARHQSKKSGSEDYDGDCELEHPGWNRVKKIATRSRVLKPRPTNRLDNDSSSSTPAAPAEGMDIDHDDLVGFVHLHTPLPVSPVSQYLVSTPANVTTGNATTEVSPELFASVTPDVATTQSKLKPAAVAAVPKPLFETPVEKPVKKFKRKRAAKYQRAQVK